MSTPVERALVMGVLNVTPDSFSDGGRYVAPGDAFEHARQMVAEGVDVVDVGGESTRPGAAPVPVEEELRRVVPVVEALAGHVRISVDTFKPAVARAAVAAGATLLNDVSGTLWELAAELSVGWVGMHMRGTPRTMQDLTQYDDVVREVREHLTDRADRAAAAGVTEVWLDPGIGFAKTAAQNLALLGALDELVDEAGRHGAQVLVGTSRKGFLGRLPLRRPPFTVTAAPAASATTASPAAAPAPGATTSTSQSAVTPGALDRFEPSLATAVWAMAAGVQMVRVHDVAPTVHAARIVGGEARAAGRIGSSRPTTTGTEQRATSRKSERTARA